MADDRMFGLSAEDVERLRRLLNAVETDILPQPFNRQRKETIPSRIIIGALTSAAAATTALLGKPKMATLNVYTFTSTGTADTGIDESVYNFAPQAATTDRWTVAERDSLTGKWIITTQFCS